MEPSKRTSKKEGLQMNTCFHVQSIAIGAPLEWDEDIQTFTLLSASSESCFSQVCTPVKDPLQSVRQSVLVIGWCVLYMYVSLSEKPPVSADGQERVEACAIKLVLLIGYKYLPMYWRLILLISTWGTYSPCSCCLISILSAPLGTCFLRNAWSGRFLN